MDSHIQSLKELSASLKDFRQNPSTRRNFPKEVWNSIISLTETLPIEEICKELEIHPAYLKRKMSKLRQPAALDFQEITSSISLGIVTIELESNTGLKAKIQGSLDYIRVLQILFRGHS